MEEMWKPIRGYEELYEISSYGRLKARQKSVVCGKNGGFTLLREKIIKILFCRHCGGYNRIQLSKNNKRKNFKIARLVALHFIDNPLCLPVVNHKDGNRKNDHVDNLEWCTYKYNSQHAIQNGTWQNYGESNYKSKLSEDKVLNIKEKFIHNHKGEFGTKYFSELYKVHYSTIYAVISGRTWVRVDANKETL